MRVVYIAEKCNIHVERMANWFQARGHEVHVMTLHPDIPTFHPGVKVHLLEVSEPKYLPRRLKRLHLLKSRKVLRKIDPDLIHGHYITQAGFYTVFSGTTAPTVLLAWGSDLLVEARTSRIDRQFASISMHRASAVLADSTELLELAREMGASTKTSFEAQWGVDMHSFRPGLDTSEWLRKLDLEGSAPIVISTRNFHPVYDLATLVRAIPLVLEKHPDTRFLLKGTGPLRKSLEKQARELKVEKSVRFLGLVDYSQIPKLLNIANIYISTSTSDGTSIAMQEAMAVGLPVIVTDILPNRSWVTSGTNGLLFESGNHKPLASAIIKMLDDTPGAERMGANNRELMKERGDQEVCMGQIEELYLRLIGS